MANRRSSPRPRRARDDLGQVALGRVDVPEAEGDHCRRRAAPLSARRPGPCRPRAAGDHVEQLLRRRPRVPRVYRNQPRPAASHSVRSASARSCAAVLEGRRGCPRACGSSPPRSRSRCPCRPSVPTPRRCAANSAACRSRVSASLVVLDELLGRELPQAHQHREPRIRSAFRPTRRIRLLSSSDSTASRTSGTRAHRVGRRQRPVAGEHGEPAEHRAIAIGEQLVTPRDRRAQVAVPRAGASRAPPVSTAHPVLEAERQLGRREDAQPRGREFDGQRQSVEPDAHVGERRVPCRGSGRRARARGRAASRSPDCPAAAPSRRSRRRPASAAAAPRTRARRRAAAARGWSPGRAAGTSRRAGRRARASPRAGARSCRRSAATSRSTTRGEIRDGGDAEGARDLDHDQPGLVDGRQIDPGDVVEVLPRRRERAGSCRRRAGRSA